MPSAPHHQASSIMFLLLTALLLLAFAPPVSPVPDSQQQSSSCSDAAPHNCDFFNATTCGWVKEYGLTFRRGFENDFNVALDDYTTRGRLRSGTACPNEGYTTHCLKFQSRFDHDAVPYAGLSVFLKVNDQDEVLLWRLKSGTNNWFAAKVPIQSDEPFQVVFDFQRYDVKRYQESTVYVDSIQYERSPCSLQPENAAPPSTPTPTTTTTTTTAAITKLTTVSETTAVRDTTAATDETTEQSPSSGASVGTIVGAVCGVLVIIVVIALVFLLARRRRLLRFKREPLPDKQPIDRRPAPASVRSNTSTHTYLDVLPPDHTYVNQSFSSSYPTHRQDSQGYELPAPRTRDGQHNAERTTGQNFCGPVTRENYASLDFADAERERRVYTSLNPDTEYVVMG